jgi:hypothetical protein
MPEPTCIAVIGRALACAAQNANAARAMFRRNDRMDMTPSASKIRARF